MTDVDPDYDKLLVMNPLPWERAVSGPVSKYAVEARGEPDDHLSARHWQDRSINNNAFLLPSIEVPGFGYRIVSLETLVPDNDWPYDERGTVETNRYRLTFDRECGGVASWYDRDRDYEWVDGDWNHPLAGFVIERIADRDHDSPRDLLFRAPPAGDENPGGLWNAAPEIVESAMNSMGTVTDSTKTAAARPTPEWGYQADWNATRLGPDEVTRHRVYRTPLGLEVHQHLTVTGLPGPVELRIQVPRARSGITVEANWEMPRDVHPASTYLTFPFNLSDPIAHIDVGDQAVRPDRDQLPASCRDYYTIQRWANLSDDHQGVTVGCPINPMVQFGDFSFGDARQTFDLERGLLLGWTTTNFYNTNFRAYQPGSVRARYHLDLHGPFDEALAHRVGRAAEHARPLVQPLAEPTVDAGGNPLPSSGRFLDLPTPPVLVSQVRPAGDNGIFPPTGAARHGADAERRMDVSLLNASDEPRSASIGSALLSIEDARPLDLFGTDRADAEPQLADGTVTIELGPRELTMVRLECDR